MPWISGNYFLNTSEMQNNALMFRDKMMDLLPTATANGIAGVLGNMETESSINPGIWESLIPYGGGYGLVQWTPYTKYSDWAGTGWEDNGDKETERILYEANNGLQWFGNPEASDIGLPYDPPITLLQLLTSQEDPGLLARYFLTYYEHPADLIDNAPRRTAQALAWYEFLEGHPYQRKIPTWLIGYVRKRKMKDYGKTLFGNRL